MRREIMVLKLTPIFVIILRSVLNVILMLRKFRTRYCLYRRRRWLAVVSFAAFIGWFVLRILFTPNVAEVFSFSIQKPLLDQILRLETSYQSLQQEVSVLSSLLATISENGSMMKGALDDIIGSGDSQHSSEVQFILKNETDTRKYPIAGTKPSIRLPSIRFFLPHLPDTGYIQPAHCLSQGRSGVSIVLGIPTVKRELKGYLVATLRNLIDNMTPEEARDTLIVVLVAELDAGYVLQVSEELEEEFPEELEAGLIDVISPPINYYPDFGSLGHGKGDNMTRVKWRSKQSLDYSFLMMYAQEKGIFYVQLEDDIKSKKYFISKMKDYALSEMVKKRKWFVISFSMLGFIGKMFKCAELPLLIDFVLMFYNDQPVDWAMFNLVGTISCSDHKDNKWCFGVVGNHTSLQYKPSLFQHVGLHSSLNGKLQRIKDGDFS